MNARPQADTQTRVQVLRTAKCPHCKQPFDLGIVRNFAGQIVNEQDFGFAIEEEA